MDRDQNYDYCLMFPVVVFQVLSDVIVSSCAHLMLYGPFSPYWSLKGRS